MATKELKKKYEHHRKHVRNRMLDHRLTDHYSTASVPRSLPLARFRGRRALLNGLAAVLRLFAVLPLWAAETLSLWIGHTHAFQLRDISTYIGLESLPTRNRTARGRLQDGQQDG